LRRFRPAGTPGAAARAGVPVDRAAETAAELGPVFARLEEIQAECARLREQASRDAEQVRGRAREQAAGLVAAARERAEGERAALVAEAHAQADSSAAHRVAEAEEQAAALRERIERRMPGLVTRVVATVLDTGATESVSAATSEAP
jgi:flagellar biosynthesis/type III secretory pathway protein FliH